MMLKSQKFLILMVVKKQDYSMKKFVIFICLIFGLILLSPVCQAKDTVNMANGSVLKGKLIRITSGLINLQTKEGFRKFSRVNIINNKDFIEVGFIRRRIIAGKIFFLTRHLIELKTPEGILKIPRYRVRKIVLGHVHEPEEQLQIQLPEEVTIDQKDINIH